MEAKEWRRGRQRNSTAARIIVIVGCSALILRFHQLGCSLLGSGPVVTPILGCNVAILVAIQINCIYLWSLTGGCIWNGAIAFLHPFDVVLQYDGFAMHKKTNATTIWLQARILSPAEWLCELLL